MDCSLPGSLLCPWSFPGKNTGGVAFPTPEDFSDPGIKPTSPAWQEDSLPLSHLGFSGGSDGKESACNAGDMGLIPGWEDLLEE